MSTSHLKMLGMGGTGDLIDPPSMHKALSLP
jgi:hypothetical protein